jgi:hypothetical protein
LIASVHGYISAIYTVITFIQEDPALREEDNDKSTSNILGSVAPTSFPGNLVESSLASSSSGLLFKTFVEDNMKFEVAVANFLKLINILLNWRLQSSKIKENG